MQVSVVNGAPRATRKIRRPKHPFHVRAEFWGLTPVHISAVLPGETLTNLDVQARIVTDPLKSKMTGAWVETYWFYVKHRDLDQRDELIAMHLAGSALTTDRATAASVPWYTYDNGINWLQACTKRVTEEYFREQGETWNTNLIGSYPAVQVNPDGSWTDSLQDDAVAPTAVTEGNLLRDDPDLTVMSQYQAQYDRMRQMRLTDWTFDDYLAAHGVQGDIPVNEDQYKPELIRYSREYVHPVNSVEPTTGVPSSAIVANVSIRADKRRFFKEPGFVVGYVCVRPKVFSSTMRGSIVGALDEARLWLPSMMRDEPYTSIKKFENTDIAGQGPLGTAATNDYWADLRDAFIYGDQFVNFDITAALDPHAAPVALPSVALNDRYATQAMSQALFLGSTAATQLIRIDGVAMPTINGTVGPDQT